MRVTCLHSWISEPTFYESHRVHLSYKSIRCHVLHARDDLSGVKWSEVAVVDFPMFCLDNGCFNFCSSKMFGGLDQLIPPFFEDR